MIVRGQYYIVEIELNRAFSFFRGLFCCISLIVVHLWPCVHRYGRPFNLHALGWNTCDTVCFKKSIETSLLLRMNACKLPSQRKFTPLIPIATCESKASDILLSSAKRGCNVSVHLPLPVTMWIRASPSPISNVVSPLICAWVRAKTTGQRESSPNKNRLHKY
jgi:hypothetical protein